MRLSLKNIGKIQNANVELNGITVIAGENNTGKSTVGKALYSVFNSFCNIENQIEYERKQTIEQMIISVFRDTVVSKHLYFTDYYYIAEEIIKNIDVNSTVEDISTIFVDFIDRKQTKKELKIQQKMIDDVSQRIFEVFKITDREIIQKIVIKQLHSEFSGQISNIYNEQTGTIELKIKDDTVSIDVSENDIKRISGAFNLHTDIVYIDNPFVLDENRIPFLGMRNSYYLDHKNHLRAKLLSNKNDDAIIREIINDNKLSEIYGKISTICSGDMVKNKRSGMGYKKKDSDKIIDIKNVSTGLKTFVILKSLLQNGTLQYNGSIILDEPEIHLHPQWQLLFAELIVLIQKEFNMHILLNTHSPYFLKSIEVYSAKHEIADRCKYYLAHMQGDTSVIDDVTDSTEKIYSLLAQPLQDLENVRY